MIQLTETEQRLFECLEDGRLHKRNELLLILDEDGLADRKQLGAHFTRMRKKLQPVGVDIACCLRNRTICYWLIRLYHQPVISDE